MAKNINHLQHIKSSVVENGKPKLPQPSVLVEGELAINYAEGVETISLKNESGTVVTFSSDNYYTEQKLGSAFTDNETTVTEVIDNLDLGQEVEVNSGDTPTGDTIELWIDESIEPVTVEVYTKAETNSLLAEKVNTRDVVTAITSDNSGSTAPIATKVVAENELTVSNALNDLDERKLDASAYTPTDLSNYYTKSETSGKTEISNAFAQKLNISDFNTYSGAVDTTISSKSDKTSTVSNVSYDSESGKLQQTINGTTTDVVSVVNSGFKFELNNGILNLIPIGTATAVVEDGILKLTF